ncbi:MAG: membrane protein insertion efficiency factor YidD [Bifidobacteriaceae bacterium]|jgi:putative membrane protein insertion efficiency factor|nr:membrane protein insertion efficiency factor YidD [Bifidobacteriaceae bacterium]
MIRLINLYQKYISFARPPKCLYFPSCSEYTKQAIRGYGSILGSILGLLRLLRCTPLAKGGFDYVPEKINFLGITLYKKENLV